MLKAMAWKMMGRWRVTSKTSQARQRLSPVVNA
jgi:hypothetical protein